MSLTIKKLKQYIEQVTSTGELTEDCEVHFVTKPHTSIEGDLECSFEDMYTTNKSLILAFDRVLKPATKNVLKKLNW